jgi:hypothetical protein
MSLGRNETGFEAPFERCSGGPRSEFARGPWKEGTERRNIEIGMGGEEARMAA